jgi:spore maturation protein CgeB
LYCSFDDETYFPEESGQASWDVGYIGTYARDRQTALEALLLYPATARPERRFVVAGPQYPQDLLWPSNVMRIEHVPPSEHRRFFNRQKFTLNLTRQAMRHAGYSPSVRLFEAAACATPIISDDWPGIDTIFTPGEEILIAHDSDDILYIMEMISEEEQVAIGQRSRERVLGEHTPRHRAEQLEGYLSAL